MPPPKTLNSKLNEQDEIHEEVEHDEHDEPEDNESDEIDREIQELECEEQRLTKLEKLRALRQKVEILKRKQSPKHVDVSVDEVEKKAQKVLARLRLDGDTSTSEDQDPPNPTSYSSSDTNQSSRSTRSHRKKYRQKRGKPSHVHSEHLRYQYASRNMKIRQFDLALFMACELDDIKQKSRQLLGDRNIIFQLEHLIKICYFAKHYEWQAIIDYHNAVFDEIRAKRSKWGDAFVHIESLTLHPHIKDKADRERLLTDSGSQLSDKRRSLYCAEFQDGKCEKSAPHIGIYAGKTATLHHFCRTCWHRDKRQRYHAPSTKECPHKVGSQDTATSSSSIVRNS